MSQEIATREVQLVNPFTGELLELKEAGTDQLAEFSTQLDVAVQRIGEMRQVIEGEWIRRADMDVTEVIEGEQYRVSVPAAGTTTRWDAGRVKETLTELIAEGVLSEAALSEILVSKPAPDPRPDARKLKKLTDRDDIGERIKACSVELPKPRSVKVEVR